MSQENQNRFLAEQFQEYNRIHAKTRIAPKNTIRVEKNIKIEPLKDTIVIHKNHSQKQGQSLPISRSHPRRTLSLNKGPSGLNRPLRSPSRSPLRSPSRSSRTKKYFNWFKRLMGPKTRKKR